MEASGALASSPSSEDRQQAFLIQYTTLMITLLAFVIGSFAGAANREKQKIKEDVPVLKQLEPTVIVPTILSEWRLSPVKDRLEFSDLFQNKTDHLNSDKAEALASLLQSHDLFVEVEISWDQCPSGEDSNCLRKALKRVDVLKDFFSKNQVPSVAYEIFAKNSASAQAVFILHELKGEAAK